MLLFLIRNHRLLIVILLGTDNNFFSQDLYNFTGQSMVRDFAKELENIQIELTKENWKSLLANSLIFCQSEGYLPESGKTVFCL